jgi:hypothetical protein
MKRTRHIVGVIFFAVICVCLAPAQQTLIQVQNNGSAVGTLGTFVRLNFTSGCTPTYANGVFAISCSGGGGGTFAGLTPGTNTSTTPFGIVPSAAVGGSTPQLTFSCPASETNTGACLFLNTGSSSTQPPLVVQVQGVNALQVLEIAGQNQQEVLGFCSATPSTSTDVGRFVHCDSSGGITGIRNLNTNASSSTGIQAEQTAASGTGSTLFSGRTGVNTNGALGSGTQVFAVDDSGDGIFAGKLSAGAATTSAASLNLPPGTAPSAPNNGDVWTTSAGLYVQIGGATVGPLIANSGYPLAFGSGAAVSNSATDYVSIGHMSASATTDSINVPRNGTISNLYCRDSGSITAGTGTVVLTAYYNSTGESLSCTLSNSSQNSCNDTTAGHAFSVTAGNPLAIQQVPTAGTSTITGGIVNCTLLFQ